MAHPGNSRSTKPLRIGIDGGTWSNRRGYGRFLRELLPELARLRPAWRLTVFLDQAREDVLRAPNVEWRVAGTARGVNESAAADGARGVGDLLRMGRAVSAERLDAVFFPTVYSYFPVWGGAPLVVGIHDTMADRHPEWAFAGKRQEWMWRAKMKLAVGQAARVVTVSEYSRGTVADFYGIARERIAVIPEAAAEVFGPLGLGEEDFVLAVGGISPNKNLGVLIRAVAELAARPRLVLVGDYRKDAFRGCYEELRALAAGLGVADRVEFAGYVPDEELVKLYNRCAVFAMPSLEEGFGLPLAEAMACGCACVVAGGHALEEVGGGAVEVVREGGDWTGALGALLGDGARRAELRRRAAERSREFTWARGAERLAAVFEELTAR